MKSLRPVAIVLPQFYPTPENDAWWGKGFTEWRNVVKTRPRFRGHEQPHLPADLGYYDLRVADTREDQASLAARYGIHGFCYYHYWFNGRRILDRPVREILESGKPDFPFMLAWANENWTRVWDGSESQVLLGQVYSDEDHRAHAAALMPYFLDPRYIRIDGKPVFAVYRFEPVPDPARMIQIFREVAREHGIELYLCWLDRDIGTSEEEMKASDIDAIIEFQPFSKATRNILRLRKEHSRWKRGWRRRWRHARQNSSVIAYLAESVSKLVALLPESDRIVDMGQVVDHDLARQPEPGRYFPAVCPRWDNTPRRRKGEATIFLNSSPALFRRWVEGKVRRFNPPSPEENLFFINAWNEWAEGNHMEPCEAHGHAYLEAFRDGLAAAEAPEHGV